MTNCCSGYSRRNLMRFWQQCITSVSLDCSTRPVCSRSWEWHHGRPRITSWMFSASIHHQVTPTVDSSWHTFSAKNALPFRRVLSDHRTHTFFDTIKCPLQSPMKSTGDVWSWCWSSSRGSKQCRSTLTCRASHPGRQKDAELHFAWVRLSTTN